MSSSKPIWRVAVPSPLRRSFDYLAPLASEITPRPGLRVKVPFGRQQVVGILLKAVDQSAFAPDKLKPVSEVLDAQPLLTGALFRLLDWASRYYHHPIGEVYAAALPVLLRQGKPALLKGTRVWVLTPQGAQQDLSQLARAAKQQALLGLLQNSDGLTAEQLTEQQANWQGAMRSLVDKGLVETKQQAAPPPPSRAVAPPALNDQQQLAVDGVLAGLDDFHPFLLNGVTGSGKTEVYLTIAGQVIASDKQVLVLVPEIGLTPQLVGRFQSRFGVPIAVMHSGLNDQERLDAWIMAREGAAPLVIGTRSAVFAPLKSLGLIIVDEEHDGSLKQQEGFRYSARDVAVMRARLERVPVLLGSATPALETLFNVQQQRYREFKLTRRAGDAQPPKIIALDVRNQYMEHGLSSGLIQQMCQHLESRGQILLFLNRRGFAPTLLCHECGWSAECKRCDTHMVLHQRDQRLRCHHCAKEIPLMKQCPKCGSGELRAIGQGTERLEEAIEKYFPDYRYLRIDRDTTRRKGSLQAMLDQIHTGEYQILIGTQMLAKGHHFPNVTLVGILDAEQGLYSADFRATERMAQQVLQVAGRAGRAERPGTVMMQTHHPDHPLLNDLLQNGYDHFAQTLLQERQQAEWPPYAALALLRAEATDKGLPQAFLSEAYRLAQGLGISEVMLLGPVPAPMERRAGRYRAQLLLQSGKRSALHQLLNPWLQLLEQSKLGRKVRWSLDVDPLDMY